MTIIKCEPRYLVAEKRLRFFRDSAGQRNFIIPGSSYQIYSKTEIATGFGLQDITDSFLKTWREQYRWPWGESRYSSEKRIEAIETLIKNGILQGEFNYVKGDLSEIVHWKASPRYETEMLQRFDRNDDTILESTIREVISTLRRQPDNVRDAMSKLVDLKGVGIPVASAFLRFLDQQQHRYGVIDRHVATFLNDQGISNFDLGEGGYSIKSWPAGSLQRNTQEYQKYHNWLQYTSKNLRTRNVTYMDVYGKQQLFAPVDIDMAIFAYKTQTTAQTSERQFRDLEMHPSTPFTNMQRIYELVSNLDAHTLRLMDKDLDSKGLIFLLRLDPSKVKNVRILIGKLRLSPAFKEECKAFRDEMDNRGISAEFRILDDKDVREVHDRYLISDSAAYNTPPWNIIHRKLGDVKQIQDLMSKRMLFDKYWSRATDISKASTK